ncbi:MAG: hypothetical protein KDJ41_10960 [Hyphomicrobiaceae bacterium]|nr:hypothetical protein [Hyphomicrobiaceae bacterium]
MSEGSAPSRLIAGFAGPLMLALGVAMLMNRAAMVAMTGEFARNQGLVFLAGILALVAGIAIVRVHNVWSGGWPVVVTVLGWLAIVGGLARMWFPQFAAPIAQTLLGGRQTALVIGGVALLALGAFLTFKAYGSHS